MYHGAFPMGMEYCCVAIVNKCFHTVKGVGRQHWENISLASCVTEVGHWQLGLLRCSTSCPNATMTYLLESPVILRLSISLL